MVTPYRADNTQMAGELLYDKFLFLLEVMSLLGRVRYAAQTLSQLLRWMDKACSLCPHSDQLTVY
jgi:hypothetical protein